MRVVKSLAAGIVISLVLSQPVLAQSGIASEPSDLSLLALGVIGVIVGHRGARKRTR